MREGACEVRGVTTENMRGGERSEEAYEASGGNACEVLMRGEGKE